jgi:threonyl-tRNA synthetase
MTLDHSVSAGGYYCQVTSAEEFTQNELDLLKKRMHDLVAANIKFNREKVPWKKHRNIFNRKIV